MCRGETAVTEITQGEESLRFPGPPYRIAHGTITLTAELSAKVLDRPVVDETRLKGRYDVQGAG